MTKLLRNVSFGPLADAFDAGGVRSTSSSSRPTTPCICRCSLTAFFRERPGTTGVLVAPPPLYGNPTTAIRPNHRGVLPSFWMLSNGDQTAGFGCAS
jgi:hypothetical protein